MQSQPGPQAHVALAQSAAGWAGGLTSRAFGEERAA